MRQRHHPDYEGTGGAGAVGLCVTILLSLIAFKVGGAGMFDEPKARMVFIEEPKAARPAVIPGTAQSEGFANAITQRSAGGG